MKKFIGSFNNLTQKKIFLLLIFIAYLILSLIFTMTHEIWTDEAQAWLIARDLSVIDIFNYMQYEGHSCLWHLINLPFAKLGFPIMVMNIFSWIITSIACYFILFHSKWNFLVKFFVIFNPTFFYWLSAITRPYCLVPILLCLFVWIYPKRHEHPYLYTNILGLTAHTHIVMCGFVGITAFFFLLE